MATNDITTGLEAELNRAIDDLQSALQRAADATSAIRTLVPRVSAIGSLFEELDTVIRSGRQNIGITEQQLSQTTYTRPTLVVPSATPARPAPAPQPADSAWATATDAWASQPVAEAISTPAPEPFTQHRDSGDASRATTATALVCFRLEFESRPGPLDLRTVDDAVSEHPSVRDVALLDYDGRKATLKVWIDGSTASPSDVQQALVERATELFGSGNDVTIVALEDAA
jgi:hypothetical protein